jgi:spore germination protein YaaH
VTITLCDTDKHIVNVLTKNQIKSILNISMRDQYIELIKGYIKEKPEYESALDELKACVLAIGATEEEFDEAIRQVTNVQKSPESIPVENQNDPEKPEKLAGFMKYLKIKKRYVIALISAIVIATVLIQLNALNTGYKITVVQNPPSINRPVPAIQAIPVVYANSNPVDAEKIFSIKSPKIAPLAITGKPKKEILGFFPYWMLSEENKINLDTLTSVSLFGLEVDGNGNIAPSNDNQTEDGSIWKNPKVDVFIKRAKSQDLKIYLTLKSFNNSNIEKIAQSDVAQKNLIANALYLVNSKGLDGINIDFEYLGNVSNVIRDGFTRLIYNLNSELKRQIPDGVLTVDTYLVSGSEKQLFNLPILAKSVDAFVIMGYDMHTPHGSPGPVSAMGGDTNIIGYVQNYLEQVDSSKLILAVPYYGYDWPKDIASPSAEMVYTLPYAEIAQQNKDSQILWNDTSQTPYFTYKDADEQNRIVYFDNVRSLGIKYDFINRKKLKGVGIWTLGYDGQNQDLEKLLIDKFINQ